ncbi:hypothetical protein JOC83_001023 [Bacillus iocasae]|uniref:Photosystem I reaction center subunit VIII n=1 Tax=Priestia iocasae TaxID=2291674 RepID=A0ABS2QRY4_9BACI|nr:hypothetical protein [Metabacillus iocasae]
MNLLSFAPIVAPIGILICLIGFTSTFIKRD